MKALFCTIFLGYAILCSAQDQYVIGAIPKINLTKKLSNGYKINAAIESRIRFRDGEFGDGQSNTEYVQTDVSFIGAKKLGHNTLGIGYLSRFRTNGEHINRLIQQYALPQRMGSFTLVHRLASDQTFQSFDEIIWRFRYRLSASFPLNGQETNKQEFYLKVSNEYLNVFTPRDYNLEIRLSSFLGYELSNSQKVEAGLNLRHDNFVDTQGSRTRFFGVLNYYLAL